MEAAVAPTGPAFLVVAPRVRAEQDTAGLEGRGEVAKDPGQLAARHVEQRGICEIVEAAEAAVAGVRQLNRFGPAVATRFLALARPDRLSR